MSWVGADLSAHGNSLQQVEGAALQGRGLGELIERGHFWLGPHGAGVAAQRCELLQERAEAVERALELIRQAEAIFAELGSPYAEQARRDRERLEGGAADE